MPVMWFISRLLNKFFSLPLTDVRGSVTAAEPAPAFRNRDREGEARSVFQQPVRVSCSLALAVAAVPLFAQSTRTSQPAFDVASVKPDKSDAAPYSNFPLNAADMYTPNGGLFSAKNWPLITYIFFAYKLQGNQGTELRSQLPGWVMTDRYDIEARAQGNPTKDQMRLMVRSVLADRFKFAVHTETKEISVFALVPAKAGKTGPQLQPHPADASCQTNLEPTSPAHPIPDVFLQKVGIFPAICNSILGVPPNTPGLSRFGGRNITIGYFADLMTQMVNPGRPMLDATGLKGTFDIVIEFKRESGATTPAGNNAATEPDGPTFEEALREQLGLRMESRRSPMEVIVLDHIERPSEN